MLLGLRATVQLIITERILCFCACVCRSVMRWFRDMDGDGDVERESCLQWMLGQQRVPVE